MNTEQLIQDLTTTLVAQMARAREVAALPAERLHKRPGTGQWNVLEVFEHMNLSTGVYERGLKAVFDARADRYPAAAEFKPGWLGAYFTNGMLPKSDGSITNRMKTMRMFDPPRCQGASQASVVSFIRMCERLLLLLQRARHTDLNKMKVNSSLGPIVRFKAGDAFRFPVAHQQRHFLQIERLLQTA